MLVIKSSIIYFRKHSLQALLAILGIVLGVSIVVAIDLCIESSKKAFEVSMQQSFGKTSHYLVSSGGDLNFNVYAKLKRDLAITKASPIIEKQLFIQSKDLNWHKIKLLGIDPFSYKDFSIKSDEFISNGNPEEFKEFLLCNNCAYISRNTAEELKIKLGDVIQSQVETSYKQIKIIKILESSFYDNLIIADISTAQNILGTQNSVSRIDLILKDVSKIQPILDSRPNLELIETLKSKESTQRILKSFNLNLYSLSFLSLIVAVFLIYNAMNFATIQRQVIFGIFRTLGLNKKHIFYLIIMETLIISAIASLLGLLLGYGLSHILIQFTTQTINDLYFILEVKEISLSTSTVVKCILGGVVTAIVGALLPAYQASNTPSVQLTRRSEQERAFSKFLPKLLLIGVSGLITSSLLLYYSKDNLILNFISLALIIISITAFIPSFLKLIISAVSSLLTNYLKPLSKISIRSISRNLSRSSIAIIALTIALSISLSLDITVNSFRATVKDWLESSLRADVYVSAPSLTVNKTTATLSQELINKLRNNNVIKANSQTLISYRSNSVQSNLGEIKLASIDFNEQVIKSFKFKKVESNWVKMFTHDNVLIISEPFAYKNHLEVGSTISLKTKYGNKKFRISGIFFDYGSDQGISMIYKKNYQSLWDDYKISSLGIIIKNNLKKDIAINKIKKTLANINREHNFNYRSNHELKTESLKIFDRTFQITKTLKCISIFIAFIAVISTLLALNLERQKEYAILAALGLSQKQISFMVMKQTLFMGIIAAVLAIPTGLIESLLLIQVINLRSFGWTLNFHWNVTTIVEVFAVAILASFIASLYPAFKQEKGYLALRND